MPYSDNMYSMEDDSAAGEDYSDQLSPSDGQFPSSSSNITPHIPNVFIPDPTLQQETERGGGAESKASEAEEDRLLSSRRDSVHRHWESSIRSLSRLEQAATATTASIPRHYDQVTYSQSSASQGPSQALPSRAWSPSVYSEAPPAYSPSPILPVPSTSATTQQDRPRNYNTFGNSRIMGAPEVESERLLGPQPESMGAPVDEERGIAPVWARRVRGRLPKWFSWKYALLALIVLIVSIAFLTGISSSHPRKDDDTSTRPALPIDKDPDAQVPDDDDHEHPGDSESPHDPGSPGPGSPFQSPYCDGQQHRYDDQILSLDFERSQNLTFKEKGYKNSGSMSVRVGGQIDVRRLNKGDRDPRMVLEIATNDPFLRLYTSLDASTQEIKVNIPETFESTVPGQRPCVEIRGTVWVPEDGELSTLYMRAIHLGISLLDDLSLKVADYTDLASVAGDVKAAVSKSASNGKDMGALNLSPDHMFVPAKNSWTFNSRVIEAQTTSGNIEGNWPLYDMLGLHSTSGNQKVSITPHGESATDPKSAILSLSTVSGDISAIEPVHEPSHIPRRDYLVDVKSTSGTVRGAFAFGGGITVHTTASDLDLDLLPVINVDKWTPQNPAQLETVTTSSEVAVRILEPVFFDDDDGKAAALAATDDKNNNNNNNTTTTLADMSSRALDCLEAKHKSTSGSVRLRYPQAWEGTLYAQTTSGRLVAKGKDLKIVKYTGGWPGTKMEARKGAAGDKSTIEVHALLGGMDAIIGDE
ncbi:hypothetical protein F4680DRAFT_223042 [Xylaria scruposa]|nr:hypothetical protein F4680DRAFT_223042 [Xylaria scruposa]